MGYVDIIVYVSSCQIVQGLYLYMISEINVARSYGLMMDHKKLYLFLMYVGPIRDNI